MDEPGWEVDPDDDWGVAVIATVGRQLKPRREAAGMRENDLSAIRGAANLAKIRIDPGQQSELAEALVNELDITLGDN